MNTENNLIATRYCLDKETENSTYKELMEDFLGKEIVIPKKLGEVKLNYSELFKKFPALQEPVDRFVEELKENEDYYRSWKDNIAMAFKDAYYNNFIKPFQNGNYKIKEHEAVHVVANKAAYNFLKQLIR